MAQLELEVKGAKDVRMRFRKLKEGLDDLDKPLRESIPFLRAFVAANYESEGASSGAPWAPLSGPYAAWKARHYPGRPILVATGEMKARTLSVDAWKIEGNRLIFDPDSDIWLYHQEGTRYIARRPILRLTAPQEQAIKEVWEGWLNFLRAASGLS